MHRILPAWEPPDSGRVERGAEKVTGRKERNKETEARMEAQQAQGLSVVREREQRVGDPQWGVGEAGRRQAQTWRDGSRDQRGEIEEEGGQAEPEVQREWRGLRPERGVPRGVRPRRPGQGGDERRQTEIWSEPRAACNGGCCPVPLSSRKKKKKPAPKWGRRRLLGEGR